MNTSLAITRSVSPEIAHCELTHLARTAIDYQTACAQHAAYEAALEALGCQITRLPGGEEFPDAVFIEDTAIVLEEAAVITRPGAESRRGETAAVAEALSPYRSLLRISAPGTLDGGDVLRLGKTLYIGISGRSNASGVEQLAALLQPYGYRAVGAPVTGCLHLKSAATQVAPETLLVNPRWVDASLFTGMQVIEVDPAEPFAANALLLGETLIYPAAYLATQERLERAGACLYLVDVSELAKAEGGVTCCSLIFEV